MLYESTYNQYFLEHSWGPWKKHLYISREGESGRFTYKYPKEYYDKYKTYKKEADARTQDALNRGDLKKAVEYSKKGVYNAERTADRNAEYYESYYDTDFDKVINRSVKAAVNALNFGLDMKDKAEGYLNRFANSVANAWNKTTSAVSSYAQKGKSFLSGAGYLTSTAAKVIAPKVASSVQNLVKGAGEAISKTWNNAKTKVNETAENVKKKVKNTVSVARARASGAELV